MRALLTAGFLAVAATAGASDKIPASGGDIVITPITHASVQIEHAGKVIQVDPWSNGDLSNARPADIILVTDIHADHLDPAAIDKVRKAGTEVVLPKAAADTAGDKIAGPKTVIANGETKTVGGVPVEAVPMYNLVRGPKPGELFHTKGRGNGYILTLGGKRVYVAGDTECTPEMKALRNIDIAFIPMNLPYTMTPAEAAECVKAFKPAIVYPYHYRDQRPEEFATALKGQGVDVRIREWYPAAPAAPK
jgi:L-ascorbate metabolism protein UlaG (beta-lactamase superfamily)